jgi:catalase
MRLVLVLSENLSLAEALPSSLEPTFFQLLERTPVFVRFFTLIQATGSLETWCDPSGFVTNLQGPNR